MSKEINDLLEINEVDNKNSNNKQNIEKHLIIRIGVPILILIILFVFSLFDSGLNSVLGLLYLGGYSVIGWIAFLLFESILLHFNKKKALRNTNLVLIITVSLLIIGLLNSMH
jgi:hypothetical protein